MTSTCGSATRSRAQRTFLVEANETIPSSHLDHEVVARHRPEAGSSGVQPERARRRPDGMDAGREFHAASLVVMTMHPLEATLVVVVPAGREFFRRLTGHLLAMVAAVAAASVAAACVPPARVGPLGRHPVLEALGVPPLNQAALTPVFKTGFERDADLTGFYVTPQSALTRHEVRPGAGRTGDRAHVGWLTGVTGVEPVDGPNHRGYPTIQLQRRPVGTCTTPCLIEFWARLDDVALKRGEWFSLGTFSADPSDRWARVITVNVGWEGWLHLFHVPDQGGGQRELQRTDIAFPRGRWVRITTWLDLDPDSGSAAVWQDGVLVSAARVRGGDGSLDQMHFGLYAPPSLARGTVANDDIAVYRVSPLGLGWTHNGPPSRPRPPGAGCPSSPCSPMLASRPRT